MEVEVNGIHNDGGRSHTPPRSDQEQNVQDLKNHFKSIRDSLVSFGKAGSKYLQHFIDHDLKDWWSDMERSIDTPIVVKEMEFLTLEKLVEIVKENMIPTSDQCLIGKVMNRDGSFNILATYCLGQEILPKNENVNILIVTEGLSRELKDEFMGGDFLILK